MFIVQYKRRDCNLHRCDKDNFPNTPQSLTRGQKVRSRREREIWYSFLQFREEKEKPEIPFPSFEKGKRNVKKGSPLSRSERERNILFSSFERRKRIFFKSLQLREEKEKSEILFPSFEKRKRNLEKCSPLSRREREMDIIFSRFERRKRISTRLFEKFSLSAKLCQSYCDSQSFRESESLHCQECDFSSNAMHKSWQLLLHVRASPRLETTLLKYFPKCCSFCCYWSLGWWFVYLHCKS